jgi:hypothetical protein
MFTIKPGDHIRLANDGHLRMLTFRYRLRELDTPGEQSPWPAPAAAMLPPSFRNHPVKDLGRVTMQVFVQG